MICNTQQRKLKIAQCEPSNESVGKFGSENEIIIRIKQ